MHAEYAKFTDDTMILKTGSTLLEIAVARMNKSLKRAHLWFERNRLNLNPSKMRYMIFNSKMEETELVNLSDEY